MRKLCKSWESWIKWDPPRHGEVVFGRLRWVNLCESHEKPTCDSKNKRAIVFGSNHRIGILYQSITQSINQSLTHSINQSINILHDYIMDCWMVVPISIYKVGSPSCVCCFANPINYSWCIAINIHSCHSCWSMLELFGPTCSHESTWRKIHGTSPSFLCVG